MKSLNKIAISSLLMLSTSVFASSDLDGFIKACVTSAGLDVEICRCVAERADRELSPGGFKFVLANLTKDKEIMESLRWRLKEPELNQTAAFMVNAPKQCAETIQSMDQKDHLVE